MSGKTTGHKIHYTETLKQMSLVFFPTEGLGLSIGLLASYTSVWQQQTGPTELVPIVLSNKSFNLMFRDQMLLQKSESILP